MKMNTLDWIAWILVIIGGLNWGLVGLFEYNLVDELFGVGSGVSKVIYDLVGLSAIYMLFMAPKMGAK
ncbi:DUF378 domain-containing protein [Candidatus Berkelbacteria bacterium]|nr:DUF378 domain-containing protein [Candidatus Berkelbacteria bacterium]